jgi:hypothetical protein
VQFVEAGLGELSQAIGAALLAMYEHQRLNNTTTPAPAPALGKL